MGGKCPGEPFGLTAVLASTEFFEHGGNECKCGKLINDDAP